MADEQFCLCLWTSTSRQFHLCPLTSSAMSTTPIPATTAFLTLDVAVCQCFVLATTLPEKEASTKVLSHAIEATSSPRGRENVKICSLRFEFWGGFLEIWATMDTFPGVVRRASDLKCQVLGFGEDCVRHLALEGHWTQAFGVDWRFAMS